MFCHSLHLICFDLTSQEPCHLLFSIQKVKLFSLLKIKEGLKQATKIELPVLMASFFRNSLIYCHFSLRCKMTFSATPESEDSLAAEN